MLALDKLNTTKGMAWARYGTTCWVAYSLFSWTSSRIKKNKNININDINQWSDIVVSCYVEYKTLFPVELSRLLSMTHSFVPNTKSLDISTEHYFVLSVLFKKTLNH